MYVCVEEKRGHTYIYIYTHTFIFNMHSSSHLQHKNESIEALLFVIGIVVIPFLFIVAVQGLFIVPPKMRLVFVNNFTGKVYIQQSGFCYYIPVLWSVVRDGPFKGLLKGQQQQEKRKEGERGKEEKELKMAVVADWQSDSYLIPAPGTRVCIDPGPITAYTKEGVSCVVDVSAEITILFWDASIIEDASNYKNVCIIRITDWVARVVSDISAEKITYSYLSQVFNSKESLEALNSIIARACCMHIDRINFDPMGIRLSQEYVKTRDANISAIQTLEAKEKEVYKRMSLDELEAKRVMECKKREIMYMEMEANAKIELDMIHKEKLRKFYFDALAPLFKYSNEGDECKSRVMSAWIMADALRHKENVHVYFPHSSSSSS